MITLIVAWALLAGPEPTSHTVEVDGRTRSFVVDPALGVEVAPLVIVLHGGGGSLAGPQRWGFTEAARARGWTTAYPSGWEGNWNDGRNAPRIRAQAEGVDDVKFIRMMVDEIARRYPVDRSRVFATGASNGGIFCFRLAREASDLLAGIAPIIGGIAQPLAQDFRINPPLSAYLIQGDADPAVPFEGGGIGRSAARSGEVIGALEAVAILRRELGITGEPTAELLRDTDPGDGARARRYEHPASPAGHRLRLDRIEGGGHSLPSPRIPAGARSGHCRDYDAAEAIIEFFAGCPPSAPGL